MSYSVNGQHYSDHQLRAYLSRLAPGATITIQKIGKGKRYGYALEERLKVIALLQLELIHTKGHQRSSPPPKVPHADANGCKRR